MRQIELTYSDNADLERAASFLVARVPAEPHQGKSLALNRYVALKKLLDFVREAADADEAISNGWNR
jgi:hypothetical protein